MEIEIVVRRINLAAVVGWFSLIVGGAVMALQYRWPSVPGYVLGAIGLAGGWWVVSNAGPLVRIERRVKNLKGARQHEE